LKIEDYHECLSEILRPLLALQLENGIAWRIPFKGRVHEVTMKIPILYICGDNEGLDKLAGRYGSRSHKVKCICRYCDIPLLESGNPEFPFKYLTNRYMVRLVKNGNIDRLTELSHHYLNNNIFHELLFCNKKRGFRAALPFDILHTIQLGWMMYIIEGVLNTQILSAEERKKEEKEQKQQQIKKQYYKADDDNKKKKTTWNVFSESRKKEFDVLAYLYGSCLQRQSDRNLPRTFFPTGVCGDQKRKGHEMPGVILIYLLIFLSQDGELYENKIGSKLLANYIHLFEMILMMEQFLKQHEFERSSIILMKDHVTAIFNLYKDTVNRKVGMGDNLIKIHLIRHIADDILNLGLPISFDSAPGENRHISAVKIPASRTQHQMHTFYEQIGMRVAEDIAIDRGYYDIECTLEHFKSLAIKDKEEKQLRNQTYRVTHDAIEKK
jgi:hypothetical protein